AGGKGLWMGIVLGQIGKRHADARFTHHRSRGIRRHSTLCHTAFARGDYVITGRIELRFKRAAGWHRTLRPRNASWRAAERASEPFRRGRDDLRAGPVHTPAR